MDSITFGILIVNDPSSNDKSTNASGLVIERVVVNLEGQVRCKDIVTNDECAIMNKFLDWSDNCKVDVIVTAGGTRFSNRNVTPQVVRKVTGKEARSVRLRQRAKTILLALQFKAVCGIRGKTLIIYLPGSPKVVEENLDFIADVIPYAVSAILSDDTKNQKHHTFQRIKAEQKLDNLSILQRQLKETLEDIEYNPREFEFPPILVMEARRMMMNRIPQNKAEIEEISLENSYNRILAAPVLSDCDLPSSRVSSVDGYAVVAEDGAGERDVLNYEPMEEEIHPMDISSGHCVYVVKGTELPQAATAVVDCMLTLFCSREMETPIRILVAPEVYQNIETKFGGRGIKKGGTILKKGTRIRAAEIDILSRCGIKKIPVTKIPVIGLLLIRSKSQEPGEERKQNDICNINQIVLKTALKQDGYDSIDFGIVKDEAKAIVDCINEAFHLVDVLVTTEFVQTENKNLLKTILTKVYGAHIHFGRVKLKRGKPTSFHNMEPGEFTAFATCSYDNTEKYLLCSTGYKDSALIIARRFAIPLFNELSKDK